MKKERLAIVTGASSGMGKEIACLLAKREDVDKILLIARREDRLRDTATEIMCHVSVEILSLNLASISSVDEIASFLNKKRRARDVACECGRLWADRAL